MTLEKPNKLPRSQTKIGTEPRDWGSLSLFLIERVTYSKGTLPLCPKVLLDTHPNHKIIFYDFALCGSVVSCEL